jgi:TatD DNase family protein
LQSFPLLVDSHAHICTEVFDHDRHQVLQKALDEGITSILCPLELSHPEEINTARSLQEKYPNIIYSAGIHPHSARLFTPDHFKILEMLAESGLIQALGEIGLDFHYNYSEHETQKKTFEHQLRHAQALKFPVVIHSRNAALEIEKSIEKTSFTQGGVMHCFTEDREFAFRMIKKGFIISFSGIITFPNAQSLREVAKDIPLSNLLIETDSPYLTPVPYRGRIKRNEPRYVRETAHFLSRIRGESIDKFSHAIQQNFQSLFSFEIKHP